MVVLVTKWLVLRPHTPASLERLVRWNGDPELVRLNDDEPAPRTPERVARSLSRWLEPADDALHLAIHARSDDEFVGFCHVAFIDRHNRRCKLGLTIGEPHARRIGYGKEAVGELVRHCFEDLGLNRVAAEVYDFNPAARPAPRTLRLSARRRAPAERLEGRIPG